AKINMFWDGVFHAAVWGMTAYGLVRLWRVGHCADVAWSDQTFIGSLLICWGLFHRVEGVFNHLLLCLPHVVESARSPLPADLAFLASGCVLLCLGWRRLGRGQDDYWPRGGIP